MCYSVLSKRMIFEKLVEFNRGVWHSAICHIQRLCMLFDKQLVTETKS